MAKIFLDTNIALDLIVKRAPFYAHAEPLLDLAIEGMIELHLSESSLPTILYTTTEIYKTGAGGIKRIIELVESCQLLSAPKHIYLQALESPFKDREDVMQYYIALHNRCDYFITRDLDFQQFKSAALPVMAPADFLKEIEPPGGIQ